MKPDVGSESRFLHTPCLHSTPHWGGGSRPNIAMTFGTSKLEWRCKNFWKICLFVSTESTNVTGGWTTDTAWRLRPRLHSAARQKFINIFYYTNIDIVDEYVRILKPKVTNCRSVNVSWSCICVQVANYHNSLHLVLQYLTQLNPDTVDRRELPDLCAQSLMPISLYIFAFFLRFVATFYVLLLVSAAVLSKTSVGLGGV